MSAMKLLILPGDGIGPEVMAEVRKSIDWLSANRGLAFEVDEDLVGGAAYDAHGKPLSDETMARAQEVDAVLLGAVGAALSLLSKMPAECRDENGFADGAAIVALINKTAARWFPTSAPAMSEQEMIDLIDKWLE